MDYASEIKAYNIKKEENKYHFKDGRDFREGIEGMFVDEVMQEYTAKREEHKLHFNPVVRDCNKCVHQMGCRKSPLNCPDYKRDPPDGGFYG